jgi:hypothetical protein
VIPAHFSNLPYHLSPNFFFFFLDSVFSFFLSLQKAQFRKLFAHLYARPSAHIHVAANHAKRNQFFRHSSFRFFVSNILFRWVFIQSVAVVNMFLFSVGVCSEL